LGFEGTHAGRDWEQRFAMRTGAKLTPASGATHTAQLDAGTKRVVWSLKYTKHRSYSVSVEEMDEALVAARAIGGADCVPAMALSFGGREAVLLGLEDFLRIVQEPASFAIPASKARTRRMRAHRLLHEDDNDKGGEPTANL